jgi:DNA-binding NtrC family response regulator
MLAGREHDQRPCRRDCCTLVVDACTDTRHALIEIMLAEGYPSIGTSRIREACTLIQSLNIELVVVNTSTFPANAIHCLRQATHRQRPAQLLAAVSYISMTGKPRRAFHFLRVADPTQIPVGIHSTDRN